MIQVKRVHESVQVCGISRTTACQLSIAADPLLWLSFNGENTWSLPSVAEAGNGDYGSLRPTRKESPLTITLLAIAITLCPEMVYCSSTDQKLWIANLP